MKLAHISVALLHLGEGTKTNIVTGSCFPETLNYVCAQKYLQVVFLLFQKHSLPEQLAHETVWCEVYNSIVTAVENTMVNYNLQRKDGHLFKK
jgi:hypothetical protein